MSLGKAKLCSSDSELYEYGSDTSDEEEMEWRRQNVPPEEIFAKLEHRTLAHHREVRARREALLLGAKSFAELLELQEAPPTTIQDVRELQLEDLVTNHETTTLLDGPDFATPTKSLPGFMQPTVSSDRKKVARSPDDPPKTPKPKAVRKKRQTQAPDVLRRSTRVKAKPDRYSPS